MSAIQQNWHSSAHEAKVEKFYSTGVEKYGEFHGGYLNFGLWEKSIQNYIQAAENLILTLGKMGKLTPHSRLLDVACGMGSQDIFLHKHFGCVIEAVDVTWKHVQKTFSRISRENLGNYITVRQGTATQLPFPPGSFTQVLSIEGPEHFKTREDFFHEAHRVLCQDGVLCLADFILKREPRNLPEKAIVEITRRLWHVPKENYDTSESYQKKLARAGFKNILIQERGEQTIVGYYLEQKRKEIRKELQKIRGAFVTWGSLGIDYLTYKAFKDGLIEYILVRAEKA